MNAGKGTKEQRDLMTSQEAKQAFLRAGLSEATFHIRVNTGQIEGILPEGRKRGAMYPRDQVIVTIKRTSKKEKWNVS